MKKRFLLFFAMLGIAGISFAQNTTGADILAQRKVIFEHVKTAGTEIGLDEKDASKLKTVFENLFKKQDEIKADTSLTPVARQEKLKAANADKDWRVQNLLGEKTKAFAEARKRLIEAAKNKQ